MKEKDSNFLYLFLFLIKPMTSFSGDPNCFKHDNGKSHYYYPNKYETYVCIFVHMSHWICNKGLFTK